MSLDGLMILRQLARRHADTEALTAIDQLERTLLEQSRELDQREMYRQYQERVVASLLRKLETEKP